MHHREVLVKLYQCTKFRVASLKFPESKGAHAQWTCFHDKGAFPVCTCARARCTPTPSNIRYRYLLTELDHCPNFHIAMSKFPEIRGLAYCTRVARAQCIITPLVMRQRIALVELHQYAKFCVASSKFPKVK